VFSFFGTPMIMAQIHGVPDRLHPHTRTQGSGRGRGEGTHTLGQPERADEIIALFTGFSKQPCSGVRSRLWGSRSTRGRGDVVCQVPAGEPVAAQGPSPMAEDAVGIQ